MEKLNALVTAEIIKDYLEKIDNIDFEYAGYNIDHEVMDREELASKISDKDILICEYDTIDKRILKNANNLKLIICCRGGYKSVIDVEEVRKKGIMVCNTPGRNADAVGDIIIGYILDLTRNITLSNNAIFNRDITMDLSTKPVEYKDTVWGLNTASPFIKYRGNSINHMTLGIVGLGTTGKALAKRAHAFGMDIIYYSPSICKDEEYKYVKYKPFDELIKSSDIISLNCSLNEKNKDFINRDVFSKMKSGSYFINTARGELVVEEDLIEFLNNNHLCGAALDVTRVEPISSDSPLLKTKNLILTPHIAGSAYDVQVEGTQIIIQTIYDWLNNKVPSNCVVKKEQEKCLVKERKI